MPNNSFEPPPRRGGPHGGIMKDISAFMGYEVLGVSRRNNSFKPKPLRDSAQYGNILSCRCAAAENPSNLTQVLGLSYDVISRQQLMEDKNDLQN